MVLILTCFVFGCASKPPIIVPAPAKPHAHGHRSNGHTAAYNKPYRIKGKMYYPMRSAAGYKAQGIASWYGYESGDRTAMGTRFRPHALTAAHKTLPLPTTVKVTNLHNGRSVVVLVNDRGPFKNNRLIDLSQGAAKKIGLNGLSRVKVEHIDNVVSQSD